MKEEEKADDDDYDDKKTKSFQSPAYPSKGVFCNAVLNRRFLASGSVAIE
jgi:hypothetical protein